MGASESKLVLKKGIFRLSDERAIPADDPYWTAFWELPESAEDVFTLFTSTDIRRARDEAIENIETLLLAVTSRLNALVQHPSFPDPELAPLRDVLNCIRLLTRVLPYLYEDDKLKSWEDNFFWSQRTRRATQPAGEVVFDQSPRQRNDPAREDAKPLGEELLDSLIDLSFYAGFTTPHLLNAKSKVNYAIWQSGVGCKQSIPTNKDIESNRCEVLRLILVVMSKAMYTSAGALPVEGTRAITYMTTCNDKQIVLSVLCSLLNTAIKHTTTSWRIPYDHMVWKDSKQALVVYSLQMLLVLLLYPIPDDGTGSQKNVYRHFLGRLHRPEDFQFLADGMTRVLSQPMQATSYLPGTQKQSKWAPEMIMLFWECLQSNKRFRSFIVDSNRMHDFLIFMIYYATENKSDSTKQSIVRMCVFIMQTMSVEVAFGKNLNKKFDAQETLPQVIRVSNFRGTYADFLIISVHGLITTSKGRLDQIYPALLAIINNMAAYAQNLSIQSSTKLLQLFATMSTPSFLLANDSNHRLLQSLLEAINSVIEHQYTHNANLVYVVLRTRKRIEALRQFTLEGGQQDIDRAIRRRKDGDDEDGLGRLSRSSTATDLYSQTSARNSTSADESAFALGDDSDDETTSPATWTQDTSRPSSSTMNGVPLPLQGMSEKARGKLPFEAQAFSRQASTSSLTHHGTSFAPTPDWIESWLTELPLHTVLILIEILASRLPLTTAIRTSGNHGESGSSPSDLPSFLQSIPQTAQHASIAAILASPSTIKTHLFEWSTLSMGWYMSVLWSLVYISEMTPAPPPSATASTITNTVTGASGAGVGPVGVWNGTNVKLFQVATDGRREGPSLSAPRGAVDAVGTKLVDGVMGLSLGGLMGKVTSAVPGLSSPIVERRDGSMREV